MSFHVINKKDTQNPKTFMNENSSRLNHNKIFVDQPLSQREFGKDITNMENVRKSIENKQQTSKIIEIRNNIFNKYATKVNNKDDLTKYKKDMYNFRPRTTIRTDNSNNVSGLNSTRNAVGPTLNSNYTGLATTANTNSVDDKMEIDNVTKTEGNVISVNPFNFTNKNVANIENVNPFQVKTTCLNDYEVKHEVVENKNPQLVAEFIDDIYEHIKSTESENLPKFGYMKNQTDINEKMRAILIDWLVEVHLKFKLVQETLFLTVNLIDRFLEKKNIMRNRLQLVGVTSMLIACKYEEIYAPEIRDFVYITDKAYTKEDILQMENDILSALEFNVTVPSSFRFLEVFSHYLKLDENCFMFCRYLLELFLIEYRMIKYCPSILAAASIYIALKITKKPEANMVPKITNYSEEKLRECAKDICIILDNVEKSSLQAIRKKFSLPKFLEVAKIKLN
jgi:cyclin B